SPSRLPTCLRTRSASFSSTAIRVPLRSNVRHERQMRACLWLSARWWVGPGALPWHRPSSRLRAFVSLDDDQIGGRHRLSQFDCLLVFGRLPAIERRLIGRKLDHRVAAAAGPLGTLVASCPHQEAGTVLFQGLCVSRNICLVLLLIGDVDAYDPIALWHRFLLLLLIQRQTFAATRRSRRCTQPRRRTCPCPEPR